jgi:hypothetical protein
MLDHLFTDPIAELLYLFPYVAQESVTLPATKKHDSKNWHTQKVHGHSGRVQSKVSWGES